MSGINQLFLDIKKLTPVEVGWQLEQIAQKGAPWERINDAVKTYSYSKSTTNFLKSPECDDPSNLLKKLNLFCACLVMKRDIAPYSIIPVSMQIDSCVPQEVYERNQTLQ